MYNLTNKSFEKNVSHGFLYCAHCGNFTREKVNLISVRVCSSLTKKYNNWHVTPRLTLMVLVMSFQKDVKSDTKAQYPVNQTRGKCKGSVRWVYYTVANKIKPEKENWQVTYMYEHAPHIAGTGEARWWHSDPERGDKVRARRPMLPHCCQPNTTLQNNRLINLYWNIAIRVPMVLTLIAFNRRDKYFIVLVPIIWLSALTQYYITI